MKKIIVAVLGLVVFIGSSDAAYTRGYTRRNGTYVSGYHRTRADHTRLNNYSTKGNVNPYTGRKGYKPVSKYRF